MVNGSSGSTVGVRSQYSCKSPDGSLNNMKYLSENPEQYKDAAIQGIRDFLEIGNNEKIQTWMSIVQQWNDGSDKRVAGTKRGSNASSYKQGIRDLLRIGYSGQNF